MDNRQVCKYDIKKLIRNPQLIAYCLLLIVASGCSVNNHSFSPQKKYSPEQLQKDFSVYEGVLEEAHPGLYWYTSKDSMDHYFSEAKQQLKDSMTESEFRRVLSGVTSKIGCGHTAVRTSKAFAKYRDTTGIKSIFPLSLKLWSPDNSIKNDTAVITANLNRKDSTLARGTIITRINDQPVSEIVSKIFNYLPTDGYNLTHKYQVMSNRGSFGALYSSLYGISDQYKIEYIDSAGNFKTTAIKPYYPASDSIGMAIIRASLRTSQLSRRERKEVRKNSARLLKIDTAEHVAMMDLNYFGRGYGLKGFFRRSFKTLEQRDINYLIIDVRNNGGGSPTNSTFLTRFITDHNFKIGDSLYAITKRKNYGRYIQGDFWNRLFITVFAKKRKDGYYHIGYFERHYFKPKKRHHFNGKIYILSGGNSFSATTLFISALINQDNVTVIGEETGGGAYGNTAWHIPTVTLPETKVRFNLPLYRLVIDKNTPKTGLGVQPEIKVTPTVQAIRKGVDYKLEAATEMIKEDKERAKSN